MDLRETLTQSYGLVRNTEEMERLTQSYGLVRNTEEPGFMRK